MPMGTPSAVQSNKGCWVFTKGLGPIQWMAGQRDEGVGPG